MHLLLSFRLSNTKRAHTHTQPNISTLSSHWQGLLVQYAVEQQVALFSSL